MSGSLRIIGAGFPRTGTSTLRAALNQLGYGPCYHTADLIDHDDHIDRWLAAYAGGPVPHEVFDGYQATTDTPSCFFWRELADAHPRAKVILTVREPRSWHRSMRDTVLRPEVIAETADPTLDRLRRLALANLTHFYRDRTDAPHLIEILRRHNAEVRSVVPTERLLVYQVTQGWGPLCAFLDVPEPNLPFPWLNNSTEYLEKLSAHRQHHR